MGLSNCLLLLAWMTLPASTSWADRATRQERQLSIYPSIYIYVYMCNSGEATIIQAHKLQDMAERLERLEAGRVIQARSKRQLDKLKRRYRNEKACTKVRLSIYSALYKGGRCCYLQSDTPALGSWTCCS